MYAANPQTALSPNERRQHPRLSVGSLATLKTTGREHLQAFVQDLSEGGALVLCSDHIRPGTEMILFLNLSIADRTILCPLEVKLVRALGPKDEDLFGYGLAINQASSHQSLEYLRQFVTYKQTGNVPRRRLHPDKTPYEIRIKSKPRRQPPRNTDRRNGVSSSLRKLWPF